jgi:RNA polymerase sigma-70 factor (ECF subfamily)
MSERFLASDATLDELEASRTFETFYQAEARTLFRRLWLVTGNRAEAEELMQDAFLRVWERWDRVGGMDDAPGYLYRTAMNLFRKRYRRATLSPSAEPSGSRHRTTTSPTPTTGRSSGTSLPRSRRGNERRSC